MLHPWANLVLLGLLIVQFATGFLGLLAGREEHAWLFWLHGIGGFAAVAVLRWKGEIVVDTVGRRPRVRADRIAFLCLAGLLLATLATGLAWTFGGRQVIAGFSLLTVHIALACSLIALLVWHVLARRFVFRMPAATGRRAFLRAGAVILGGMLFWQSSERVGRALTLPGSERRFTGSYEIGSGTGVFPVVSWLFDRVPAIVLDQWTLSVGGLVARPLQLRYADLEPLSNDVTEVLLDCTGGWYTVQEWSGVSIARLLQQAEPLAAGRSIAVRSATGYWRRFSLAEAPQLLLAVAVAGRPLDTGHGYPIRLVAPGHRGFAWVKWVTHITVEDAPPILQPPVPLQ